LKEILNIPIRKENLHGILYFPDDHKSPLPLIIHINGMPGKSPEEDEKRFATEFVNQGLAYYTYDHQGVRESSGIFTYYDAQENLEKVIDYLVQDSRIDPTHIGLFGESFGGSMAFSQSVRDNRIKCLTTRSPVYDTDIIPKLPFFTDLTKIWARNKQMRFPDLDLKSIYLDQTREYNPMKLGNRLKMPYYLIAGDHDELLQADGFTRLFEIVKSSKKNFDLIKGANHNFSNPHQFKEMRKKIIQFFKENL
ncbi:MAG: alpha/beta hydrolase family protein, partial [Promethearchaeota archaeon]